MRAHPARLSRCGSTPARTPGVVLRCGLGNALIAVLALAACSANATTIRVESIDLGSSQYRSLYTVTNDGSLGVPLQAFDLYFDPGLYLESSLAIVTAPPLATDWDQLILGSGVLVAAAYDAVALDGGIPDGTSESGFAVEFTWIGPGTPGAQPFEIFDPQTFDVLESGLTTPIPETSTLSLLAAGISLLARRPRSRHG